MAGVSVNEDQAELEDEGLALEGDELADEQPEPDSRARPDEPAAS
ncbi:MAG: hypothetical protein QOJ85_1734 [Solirubrobacteraceae bacterium]|jgi:hypothetical protein|nr:hypothetical protein [Solirubrobacteraceae bacterium]